MQEYDLTQKTDSDMLKLIDFRLKQIEEKMDTALVILNAIALSQGLGK